MVGEPRLSLEHLVVAHVRNLAHVDIHLHLRENLFIGANGSGKTSLLEAVHILGTGRPLRGTRIEPVIDFAADSLLVQGVVRRDGHQHRVGVERDRHGNARARVDQEDVRTAAALAEQLPLVVLHAGTVGLVSGPRGVRRRQLDWGVFHVEPAFATASRKWRRAFAQRNAAVRGGVRRHAMAWDEEFVALSDVLQQMRARHVSGLEPVLGHLLPRFGLNGAGIALSPGWDVQRGLAAVLDEAWGRDVGLGHTTRGPHRAELRLLVDNRPAGDVLSRGQQKLFAYAVLLAQAEVVMRERGLTPVALVDDLMAELDIAHAREALLALRDLACQVWLTGVDERSMDRLPADERSVFHVERGTIRNVTA